MIVAAYMKISRIGCDNGVVTRNVRPLLVWSLSSSLLFGATEVPWGAEKAGKGFVRNVEAEEGTRCVGEASLVGKCQYV